MLAKLEREANMIEVRHFCDCLESYIMDGFSGQVSNESIQFQAPLINNFWWQTLLERGVKKEIIKLGAEFNPLHTRRLASFHVKKQGDKQNMFLHRIK